MTANGKRFLTPRELDEWYDAINAVIKRPKLTTFRPVTALPVTVSADISLTFRDPGSVKWTMPLPHR